MSARTMFITGVAGFLGGHLLRAGLERTIDWIAAKGPRPFEYHLPLEIANGRCAETWARRMF